MKIKRDLILIGILISVSLVFLVIWFVNNNDIGNYAVITHNDEEVVRLPLNTDTEYEISGDISLMHIHIKDGYVYVHDSGCSNQICVNTKKTNKKGAIIACIPNGVIIKVIKV